MELRVFEMGLNAGGHVNLGSYIIHPKVSDNRQLYIEFQNSEERLGLQVELQQTPGPDGIQSQDMG